MKNGAELKCWGARTCRLREEKLRWPWQRRWV